MLLNKFLFRDASFAFGTSQAQTIRVGHYIAFKTRTALYNTTNPHASGDVQRGNYAYRRPSIALE